MFEILDPQPLVQVQDSEYRRLLGFPDDYVLSGRPLELAQWARNWYARHGRPWVYAREAAPFDLKGDKLKIEGCAFSSQRLLDLFAQAGAQRGILAGISAGPECEQEAQRLWREEKPDEYFFLEIFGSAVVEHLVTFTGARLCAWAEPQGLAVLPHYSPGYTGWDVADQVKLFELLSNGHGRAFPREIQVKPSGMLQPKKSLLALFGLTRHRDRVQNLRDLIPCETCSFPTCQYRRAPFQRSLLQFEDVRRLQPPAQPTAQPAEPVRSSGSGLDRQAKYTVNARALQKWSRERLELRQLPDRSFQAVFRYEGTTCSNLGQPLEYRYHLRLGPPEQGYCIQGADCAPAPGDLGHAKMCAWLEDAERVTRSIANEKPLLGQPLNDILTWSRPHRPAGCYCDAESRRHKWGLVLEVIHFALVQREKESELK